MYVFNCDTFRIQDQLAKLRRNQERRQQRKAAREAAKAATAATDSTYGLSNKDKKTDTIVKHSPI